jgi:hypothetical protein
MKNKIDRPEIYIDLAVDKFVLRREEDGKIIKGTVVKYIEWNENGTFKAVYEEPAVGRSIIVDPAPYGTYRWMTTEITEILPNKVFKTKNSTYTLYEL